LNGARCLASNQYNNSMAEPTVRLRVQPSASVQI